MRARLALANPIRGPAVAHSRARIWRRGLLVCGVVSSVAYVAADALGALRWEGYSYASQAISELSAIGAPSRRLVAPLFFCYSLLALAFGLATILILLAFGAMAGRYAPHVEAGLPTPWLGVVERICVFSYLLWQAVLAVQLLRPALARVARKGVGTLS